MAHATLYFPKDFRWGTATAAHQVEGYNTNSDWWQWEQDGHCLNRATSAAAANWWDITTATADLDRAADMGTNAHRLSIEWSRIEPEPSQFSSDALDHYRTLLEQMHARKIEPMVTLHHFSNPIWLVAKGDFQSDVVVDYFQRYTRKVVQTLGHLIPRWITINEPIVYFALRHLQKVFPAPKNGANWQAGIRGLVNMLRCHAAAYHVIKETLPKAQVGIAKHIRPFHPLRPHNPLDRFWTGQLGRAFNEIWLRAHMDGRLRWPLPRLHLPTLANTLDFIGINYYSPSFAKFPSLSADYYPAGTSLSDTGYGAICPAGLRRALHFAHQFGKPIYITENGLPDAADTQRPAFLLSHLHQMWHALNAGIPIMGYYHWSLIDNFEWDRGWTQRFGLIALDEMTQARQLRPSGRLYTEICQQGAISSYQAERFAPALLPQLFPGSPPVA